MLLHAKRFWSEAITPMLWPFTVSKAIRLENELSMDANGKTPLQRLTASDVPINLRDYHTWGCPVYVLESRVQTSSKGLPKWDPRARIGIYLGHSTAHAGNVALVLNLSLGYVSPQFHVVLNDNFDTCNEK